MKIAFIAETFGCPGYWGGISRYTQILGAALARLGHEVHVFSMAPAGAALQTAGFPCTLHSVAPWRPRLPGARTVYWKVLRRLLPGCCFCLEWSVPLVRRLAAVAREGGLDLVEAPETGARLAWRLGRLSRSLPVAARLHSPSFITAADHYGASSLHARQLGWMERRFVRGAFAVSAPSRSVAELTAEATGPLAAEIAVIPHPVPVPPLPERGEDSAKRVAFVGRLESLKGFDILLKAMPAVLAAHPETVLEVVGPDPHRWFEEGLAAGVARHLPQGEVSRVARALRLHGHLAPEEADRVRGRAAVVAVPSRYESFSFTLTEAMALGRPVVASAAGAMPEIVEHGGNGLLVEPGRPEALAEALIRLLAAPGEAEEMGRRARRDIASRYAPERVAAALAGWYGAVRERWLAGPKHA